MIKIIFKISVFSVLFASKFFSQDFLSQDFFPQAFAQENYQKNSDAISQPAISDVGNAAVATQKKEIAKEKEILLSKPPQIASSINPIHQIAKFISGDDKNNSLLINPRVSEHDYQFKVSNINTLNKVDVVFYVGDGLENYFVKALSSLEKQPKVVQLSKSKYVKLLSFQSRVDEDNTDYHIWLNPENAIGVAAEIAETLSALYPSSANLYKKNLQRFILDIKKMDEENKIKLFQVKSKSFVVDHDSIAYFENYYDMQAAGVMRRYRDQTITPKDVERINNLIKANKVSCILGNFQERNNLVVQLASNNKIKFILIDIMGSEMNHGQNGYTKIISGLVDDLVKCIAK
jgi:zinc transport system substrate-binding protein